MNTVINTIVVGIIATLSFEILKYFVLKVMDLIIESRIPFSLTGFWVAFSESKHPDTHEIYSAYEFVRLRIERGKIIVKIYQVTNDSRKHIYKGLGYLRGSKLSISYEDYSNPHSELCGSYNLRVSKKNEHSTYLAGSYTEFQGKEDILYTHDYCLFPYVPTKKENLALRVFGKKYIFNLMENNQFKEDVNKEML